MEDTAKTTIPTIPNPVDPLLQFIGLNGYAGNKPGITLFVSGTIITGNIIGAPEYCHLLSKIFRELPEQNEGVASWADYFDKAAKHYESKFEKGEIEEEQIGFLHLTEATYIQGNVSRMATNAAIRIRLDAIDGFILGRYQDGVTEDGIEA